MKKSKGAPFILKESYGNIVLIDVKLNVNRNDFEDMNFDRFLDTHYYADGTINEVDCIYFWFKNAYFEKVIIEIAFEN